MARRKLPPLPPMPRRGSPRARRAEASATLSRASRPCRHASRRSMARSYCSSQDIVAAPPVRRSFGDGLAAALVRTSWSPAPLPPCAAAGVQGSSAYASREAMRRERSSICESSMPRGSRRHNLSSSSWFSIKNLTTRSARAPRRFCRRRSSASRRRRSVAVAKAQSRRCCFRRRAWRSQ